MKLYIILCAYLRNHEVNTNEFTTWSELNTYDNWKYWSTVVDIQLKVRKATK